MNCPVEIPSNERAPPTTELDGTSYLACGEDLVGGDHEGPHPPESNYLLPGRLGIDDGGGCGHRIRLDDLNFTVLPLSEQELTLWATDLVP